MSLFDTLNNDIGKAMRSGDKDRVGVLRMLKSAVHNESIAKKKPVDDELFLGVVQREIKKRKEAIESFNNGGRDDLVKKESDELDILLTYQPPQLSPAELQEIIKQTVEEFSSDKNFGQIMKAVMDKVKGKADGKEVAGLVKEILAN